MVAERSVRLMQCGLVFFLLLFSEYLGISRRNIVFGIALGFGLFAAVNMLIAVSMTHPVYLHRQTLRWINSAAYNVSVVIWLSYALRAPARRSISSTARPQDWNYALEDRLQPEADSLLDTMDRTVERLLYPAKESRVSVSSAHN